MNYIYVAQMMKLAADDSWKTAVNPATHTIAKGNTIGALAKQYGTTSKAIMDLNPGLNANKLQLGQKIKLPQWTERRRIWETNKIDPEFVLPLENEFLNRMRFVESSGNDNAYNKATGATGPLQFRDIALKEINNIRGNKVPAWTLNDLKKWNNAKSGAEMLNQKWGKEYQYRTGKPWVNDYYARRHNIGNDWENNDRGAYYLKKMYSDATSDAIKAPRIPGGIAGAPNK